MPVVRSGDLEASRAFYVGFLGFDVGMDEEGFLMLRSSSTPTTQLWPPGTLRIKKYYR